MFAKTKNGQLPEHRASQEFPEVINCENGVMTLKNGGLRKVIAVSGLNFDLKSEEDQEIILGAYRQLLNSIDFSLQIVMQSRRMNIEPYLATFDTYATREKNERVQAMIREYKTFLRSLVEENSAVVKQFFIVVPYDHINLVEASKSFLQNLVHKKKTETPEPNPETARIGIETLNERAEKVLSGLASMGLQGAVLDDAALFELVKSAYNPHYILHEKNN